MEHTHWCDENHPTDAVCSTDLVKVSENLSIWLQQFDNETVIVFDPTFAELSVADAKRLAEAVNHLAGEAS